MVRNISLLFLLLNLASLHCTDAFDFSFFQQNANSISTNTKNKNIVAKKPVVPANKSIPKKVTLPSKVKSQPQQQAKKKIEASQSSDTGLFGTFKRIFHKPSPKEVPKPASSYANFTSYVEVLWKDLRRDGHFRVIGRLLFKWIFQHRLRKRMIGVVLPELDEELLTQLITVLSNLVYCLVMLVGFYVLPREVMLVVGVVTALIGPFIAFLVLAAIGATLYILSLYPTICMLCLCVFMFFAGKVGQSLLVALGLDADRDGDVDLLDLLKLLANTAGGDKTLLGRTLNYIHELFNGSAYDILHDIRLDVTALKIKFDLASVEEKNTYLEERGKRSTATKSNRKKKEVAQAAAEEEIAYAWYVPVFMRSRTSAGSGSAATTTTSSNTVNTSSSSAGATSGATI